MLYIASHIFFNVLAQNNVNLAGGFNSWSQESMTKRAMSKNIFIIKKQISNAYYEFLFWGDGTKYGRGDVISLNQETTWYEGGENSRFTFPENAWYTFTFLGDPTWKDRIGFVFKTPNPPVTISSVSNNVVAEGRNIVVEMSSSPTSNGEKVYVRYTKDGWTTSKVVNIPFAGSIITDNITIQSSEFDGGNDDFFYVFTSPMTITNDSYWTDSKGLKIDLATIEINNNDGSNYILPVELTSFSGRDTKTGVNLNWNTATEISNNGFDIERSLDKNNWQKIAFVNGNGNSNSPKNYSYTDNYSFNGTCYYRLKQIDTDGKYTYSKVIEIKGTGSVSDFNLAQNYPNPFNPCTNINFSLNESGKAKLVVYDILGKERAVLFNGNVEAGKNYNVSFNGSNLESGVYFYKLTSGSVTSVKKMMLVK